MLGSPGRTCEPERFDVADEAEHVGADHAVNLSRLIHAVELQRLAVAHDDLIDLGLGEVAVNGAVDRGRPLDGQPVKMHAARAKQGAAQRRRHDEFSMLLSSCR